MLDIVCFSCGHLFYLQQLIQREREGGKEKKRVVLFSEREREGKTLKALGWGIQEPWV